MLAMHWLDLHFARLSRDGDRRQIPWIMTIAARLCLGFLLVLVIIGGLGGGAIIATNDLRELTVQLYEHPFRVCNAAQEVRADIQTIRLTMIGVGLAETPDAIGRAAGLVDQLDQRVRANLRVIRQLFLGDPRLVTTVVEELDRWQSIRTEIFDAGARGDNARALAVVRSKGTDLFQRVDAAMTGIVDSTRSRARDFAVAADASGGRLALTVAIGLVLALGIGLGVASLTTMAVSWPLSQLASYMRILAETGDGPPVPLVGRRDEIGAMARAVAVFKDHIRQRRAAETGLRDAKDAAELALRVKSEFLSVMSHELRTPLNTIIGFSDPALYGSERSDLCRPCHDHLRLINEAGNHLLALVDALLDIATFETGAPPALQEEAVDLVQILDDAERLTAAHRHTGGVTLCHALVGTLPRLWGDRLRLRQILVNLLSNAFKFTPRGGRVTIGGVLTQTGTLILSVSDTGIGMRAEDVPTALSLFSQLDTGFSRQHSGTGLGLPLTKRLVELHGGFLDIASQPNRGTTVTLTFPRERVLPEG